MKNRIDTPRSSPPPLSPPERASKSYPSKPQELWYLPLDPEFTAPLSWTNDPNDLSIETYFNPNKINLGQSYNIKGLRPVLREEGEPYNFILVDDEQRWYLWDEYDGLLLWVKSKELEALTKIEDKADFVLLDSPAWRLRWCTSTFIPLMNLAPETCSSWMQFVVTEYVA
jgi:hypothetical protein